MKLLLRFELHVAFAAVRRIVAHPSRRLLWLGVAAFAAVALVFDVATSDVASRNLGAWRPSALLIVLVSAGILAFAALTGTRRPSTYGTRAPDAVWWRYAGVDGGIGQRATTAILTVRATLFVALGAVPVAAVLALAAPQRAGTIVTLAALVIVLAPSTVLVSSMFAPRSSPGGTSTPRATAVRASRANVPSGFLAARWLIATLRNEMVVPFDRLAFGLVAGLVAPRVATFAGGQTVALAIVVGGLAVLLDAAIRGTTAPATLRSPWWRAAVGTSPRALIAWAFCDGIGAASPLIGTALGLGLALRLPLPALAALPAIVLVPMALRLVVLAVDAFFPAKTDRYGAGASLRVFVVFELTADIFALALLAGARGGALASFAATSAALIVVIAAAGWCAAARLPHASG